MCGRFNIISDPFTQLIMNIANEEFAPEHYQSRYNIAPTENVPVLLRQTSGAWAMRSMRWWLLPRWANEVSSQYTMFNAKAENLLKSRVFKPLFSSQRCIIPVTGYYEWSDRGGKKTPYLVTPETEPGFGFAGLWECWQKNGQIIESCTVITGAAPSSLSQLHGRVPLHLGPDEIKCWLDPASSQQSLLAVLTPTLKMSYGVTPLNGYVGNARHKDAGCLEAIGETWFVS